MNLDTSSGSRVVLVTSRYPEWAAMASDMATCLHAQVPDAHIEHIGSTSVPGLPAKNVVDLLIGVPVDRVTDASHQLAAAGYDPEGELPCHCWLSFPHRSARRYILHVVEFGGSPWNKRIAFRNLLRADGSARDAYLIAKLAAAENSQNWDDYTQAKTPTVAGLLAGCGPIQ